MDNNLKKLSCLNSFVRITTKGNNVILSNLSNGKWFKLRKKNVNLFNAINKEGVLQNCILSGLQYSEAVDFVETLVFNNFLAFEDSPEFNKEKVLFGFQSAYVHVTNACNLACKHCYRDSNLKSEYGVDTESLFIVIDRLKTAGVKFLVIAGGEPLLRNDIEELLKYINYKRFDSVTLLTNGTTITEKLAKSIASCVDSVHVSLDGPNEKVNAQIRGQGNFEKTIKGIKKLKSAKVNKIKIITCITSVNLSHMDEMLNIQKELGVDLGTSIFAEVGRGAGYSFLKPNISEVITYFKDKTVSLDCNPLTTDPNLLDISVGVTCGSGTYMISIDCFGNIFPCHLLHKQELKIGNILEQENLLEIIQKSSVIKRMKKRIVENRKCHGCSVEYFCKGGCLAHTISANKQSENPWIEKDPFCKVHKEILSLQLWEDE